MISTQTDKRITHATLVYQAGIANVFTSFYSPNGQGCERKRLIQSDFRTCEAFARGLEAAGVIVTSLYYNQAGDITNADWMAYLEDAPFSDSFRPVGQYAFENPGVTDGVTA